MEKLLVSIIFGTSLMITFLYLSLFAAAEEITKTLSGFVKKINADNDNNL